MCKAKRLGATLIELLVVIAIVGLLAGLLLPAVQASREAARAMRCKNNLKQTALATLSFHDARGAFPPARLAPRPWDVEELSCGNDEPSWLVRIMPYLERGNQADKWDVYKPFSSHPEEVRNEQVDAYLCPLRRASGETVSESSSYQYVAPCGCIGNFINVFGGAVGDYAGNHGDFSPGAVGASTDFYFGGNGTGVIISSRARCTPEGPVDWVDKISSAQVRDGLSNTLLAGEMHVPAGMLAKTPSNGPMYSGSQWTSFSRFGGPGVSLANGAYDQSASGFAFGSWHPGVCHVAFSDGTVKPLRNTIPSTLLGRLCHRDDSEVVGSLQ